jgi:site-specific DNA-cytosine methylase
VRLLDLCAGIGGFSLAAEWMGWEVAGHVEIEPFCQSILRKHWPSVPLIADIHDCKGDEFGPLDIITAGIPCQPFSVSGKRRGHEDVRHLWPEALRLVGGVRPRWVVVENVGGFVGMALDATCADLEEQGYEVGAALLPACGVEAPHIRNRIWIIAHDADPNRHRDNHLPGYVGRHIRGDGGLLQPDLLPKTHQSQGPDRNNPGHQNDADPKGQGRPPRGVRGGDEAQGEMVLANLGNGTPSRGIVAQGGVKPTVGGVIHGIPGGLAGPRFLRAEWNGDPLNAFQGGWDDGVPRLLSGREPGWGKKIRALGNALVPQVAYQLFRMIEEVEMT